MSTAARALRPREADIQRLILSYLLARGLFAWRVNQAGVMMRTGAFRPGPTRGVSDILGVLPGGRFFAIEVKRPGERPTIDQMQFMESVRRNDGIAFVATSLEDVQRELTPARSRA